MLYDLSTVTFVEAEDECIVCGELYCACRGDGTYDVGFNFEPAKPIDDPAATFVVKNRVYVKRWINGTETKTLLHGVGSRIRPDEAKRLGLIPNDGEPSIIET